MSQKMNSTHFIASLVLIFSLSLYGCQKEKVAESIPENIDVAAQSNAKATTEAIDRKSVV